MAGSETVKPLRMGMVGLNFGRHIVCDDIPNRACGRVEVVKVCDMREETWCQVQDYCTNCTTSFDELLEDPEIDVIGLFTGPNGRAKMLDRCLDAGKDVMTTKPFERDPAEAMRVLLRAKELGRVIHMNSPNARPQADLALIQQFIAEGTLGTPTLAIARTWAYYGATPPAENWYDDPDQCPAAPLFRLGIYPLNSLSQIFGPAESVTCQSARVETLRPTADNATMGVKYRSGAIASLTASFVVGGKDFYQDAIELGGTKGVVYLNPGPRPREDRPRARLVLSTEDRVESFDLPSRSGDYDWEFFYQRVTGQVAEDVTQPEQIVESIRVVDAMRRAEQSGCAAAV